MTDRRIVAIVSDFGVDSFYVGVMKGVLRAAAPDHPVVDLTHSITPHDVAQASFVLDISFDFLPAGAVVLAVVDPGVGGDRNSMIVEIGGRYIVGPDNGITTEIAARLGGMTSYTIDESRIDPYRVAPATGSTFWGRDVFAPAAAALAVGIPPHQIGVPATSQPVLIELPAVDVGGGKISGRTRYVDEFGNLLTAITESHLRAAFGETERGRIGAAVDGIDLGPLCAYYSERPPGTLMALLNAWNRVEVSVCEGRAADRFAGRDLDDLVVELREYGGR
jgi:S-adenosylmethionine hydrolase